MQQVDYKFTPRKNKLDEKRILTKEGNLQKETEFFSSIARDFDTAFGMDFGFETCEHPEDIMEIKKERDDENLIGTIEGEIDFIEDDFHQPHLYPIDQNIHICSRNSSKDSLAHPVFDPYSYDYQGISQLPFLPNNEYYSKTKELLSKSQRRTVDNSGQKKLREQIPKIVTKRIIKKEVKAELPHNPQRCNEDEDEKCLVSIRPCRRSHTKFSPNFCSKLSCAPYKYLLKINNCIKGDLKIFLVATTRISKFSNVLSNVTPYDPTIQTYFKCKKRSMTCEEIGNNKNTDDRIFEIQMDESSAKTKKFYCLKVKDKAEKVIFQSTPFLLYVRKSKEENLFWQSNFDQDSYQKTEEVKIRRASKKRKRTYNTPKKPKRRKLEFNDEEYIDDSYVEF